MKHTNRLLNHRNNLATLIQSLFYPATLGAGVVWTLEQFGQGGALKQFPKDIAIYFSILLVIYFSRSFLMINDAIKRQSYNLPAFILDFFQIALIVFAFFLLRMPDMCSSDNRCLSLLYFVFTPIPIIDALWNLAAV